MQVMMTLAFALVIPVVIVWTTLFRFTGLLCLKFNRWTQIYSGEVIASPR